MRLVLSQGSSSTAVPRPRPGPGPGFGPGPRFLELVNHTSARMALVIDNATVRLLAVVVVVAVQYSSNMQASI